MKNDAYSEAAKRVPRFKRKFFDSAEAIMRIGGGSLGGKALGLAFIKDIIATKFDSNKYPDIKVNIPTLAVIATDFFDNFMQENDLFEIAYSDRPDDRIAHAFQKASLPAPLLGDLRALIAGVKTPLAVRSSSLLEDAIYEPFAGVYATKMIPNNQPDIDTRFQKLVEAIKFVYSSAFFKDAKSYIRATKQSIENEKMAVIIQEVVGRKHWERYYPHIAGVGRSYNFYPTGHAKPEHGVVDLALGLGKTIVDGGMAWSYSPTYPKSIPPFNSINDLLRQTQTTYWAINMEKITVYDPIKETEYMVEVKLKDAELDGTLPLLASTYIPNRDRIVPGTGPDGPRILNFAPILQLNDFPLNNMVKSLLQICEEAVGTAVEVEFAVTLSTKTDKGARFGFLQVRPMVVTDAKIDVSEDELTADNALVASNKILGNGLVENIKDVIYVKPDVFSAANVPKIAMELEKMNLNMVNTNTPYLLIGFGRWGSSDPWLGINVTWGQISGAKVIVEATLPNMNVELSQGSHFFHNITSFQICYFSVHHDSKYKIDWEWMERQEIVAESDYVKHIRFENPLTVKVDGRTGRGVIQV
jgi:Pyruvate phosphate dikinase, AMP/ATP-binding domain